MPKWFCEFSFHQTIPCDAFGYSHDSRSAWISTNIEVYWSQLEAIINRCENCTVDVEIQVRALSKNLSISFNHDGVVPDTSVTFILKLLEFATRHPNNRRYDIATMRQSALLYLEAEFGVYSQMSGGNYFISVEQVLLSARLRRMKPYTVLELDGFVHNKGLCCDTPLSDEELSTRDDCYVKAESLSMAEKASVYYIAGYITLKEKIAGEDPAENFNTPLAEFTEMMSRGKLKHPPKWLFNFACLCFGCFTLRRSPSYALRVRKLFAVGEFYFAEADVLGCCVRLTNYFFKGYVQRGTKSAPSPDEVHDRKILKLSGQ